MLSSPQFGTDLMMQLFLMIVATLGCCFCRVATDSYHHRHQDSDIGPSFWQVADLHVNLTLKTPEEGLWGYYPMDTSRRVIESAFSEIRRRDPSAFIVYTGDTGEHSRFLTYPQLVESIKFSVRQIKRALENSSSSLFPVLGNHDVFPVNNMSPHPGDKSRIEWCTRLATDHQLYADWIDTRSEREAGQGQPPYASFKTNCFHSRLLPGPRKILLLGLNGLVWYSDNKLVDPSIEDPLGQFAWIEKSLLWAREQDAKAIIVSHFPLGASENAPYIYKHLHPVYNNQLLRLLRTYHDVIITSLVAHEHVDSFRVVLDKKCNPVGTMFLAPSLDPFLLDNLGDFNPRIRRYRFDSSGDQIISYDQYWFNLSSTEHQWGVEYQTNQEYDLEALNASQLATLLDWFTLNDAPIKWDLLWNHELGLRQHAAKPILDLDHKCPRHDSVCRCEHICAMRHHDLDNLNKCLRLYCQASETPEVIIIKDKCWPRMGF